MNSLRLGENKEYQAIQRSILKLRSDGGPRQVYDWQSASAPLLLQRQELRTELNQRIAAAVPGAKAKP